MTHCSRHRFAGRSTAASTRGCERACGRDSVWFRGCAGFRATSVCWIGPTLQRRQVPCLPSTAAGSCRWAVTIPIYFPGRIEDLDLGFRGWMAGLKGYYEPRSVAYHRGFGTFGPELGIDRCNALAIRNSFLFAWKNLRGFRLLAHLFWVPAAGILAAARADRPGCQPGCRGAAVCDGRTAGNIECWRGVLDRAAGSILSQVSMVVNVPGGAA